MNQKIDPAYFMEVFKDHYKCIGIDPFWKRFYNNTKKYLFVLVFIYFFAMIIISIKAPYIAMIMVFIFIGVLALVSIPAAYDNYIKGKSLKRIAQIILAGCTKQKPANKITKEDLDYMLYLGICHKLISRFHKKLYKKHEKSNQ